MGDLGASNGEHLGMAEARLLKCQKHADLFFLLRKDAEKQKSVSCDDLHREVDAAIEMMHYAHEELKSIEPSDNDFSRSEYVRLSEWYNDLREQLRDAHHYFDRRCVKR